MKRPTFFISSTIYDFRDLRSALKFFLEELGCKVLASEYNDFTKSLDLHTYEACLQSIHSADYFILLIGSRVGGWYREKDRISITQREYREAYQLHAAGRLKLLNFVRSEVWTVREDRRELVKFLKSTGLDPSARAAIANHPSKVATDAEFIAAFINEVSKNAETKAAVSGKGEPPTGNWIHTFSSFRDVVDVLNQHVLSSIPMEDLTVKRLLRRELRQILSSALVKVGAGRVFSPRLYVDEFHAQGVLTMATRKNDVTRIDARTWDRLAFVSFHLIARQFHAVVLPQILSRPTFLLFDLKSDKYVETPVYEALLRLQDEIRRFNECNTSENLQVVYRHAKARRPTRASHVDVETVDLAGLLHVVDRWVNVVELSTAVLKHLEDSPFQWPALRPDSPVQGMQEELDRERPTEVEIDRFMNDV